MLSPRNRDQKPARARRLMVVRSLLVMGLAEAPRGDLVGVDRLGRVEVGIDPDVDVGVCSSTAARVATTMP